ncbi:unnamed protein product [Plutella xylostella]|uniref:(diamondback moth) hypothetical protein n=1 Tax=Plutella xylostella TaxID=51655 RepID=A0A8S4ESF9_PLUXY|nr:unnamed protein product [Plutella xylostella]
MMNDVIFLRFRYGFYHTILIYHEALKYDVGVYFEANGHGTVVYSGKTKEAVRKIFEEGDQEQRKAASILLDIIDMTNETVGDALSDLFLVETALCARGINTKQWMQLYDDLPCQLMKLSVKDRNVVTTADADRQCTSPEGLQSRIDELVATVPSGRSFVRASGTEDVVRVYAEADTQENVQKLAVQVAQAVYDLAGGVGTRPTLPE